MARSPASLGSALCAAVLALCAGSTSAGTVTAAAGGAPLSVRVPAWVEVADSRGADYDRGYRDGYERKSFRDRDRDDKRAYAEGYRAGEADRRSGVDRGGVNVAAPRSTEELVGRSSARLEADMKALGYKPWGQFKQGRESFTLWRGADESQCLRVMAREGRVRQVTGAGETECK